MIETVICPYCQQKARLADGAYIYPHRRDLADKPFYLCEPCDAFVGCHPGTLKPLGRLADAKLRSAKSAAHATFDPIWKTKQKTRSEAYAWLATELGISPDECHIGMFDFETCRRTVEICIKFSRSKPE